MSNDNKTLADAQPGGRVRLGNGPTIEKRARELLAAEHRKCDRNTEADLVLAGDVTVLGQIALNAIIAALSAQPSPGGQDALEMVGANLRSIMRLCRPEDYSISRLDAANIHMEALHTLQLLEAALAARQPVGEPAGPAGLNECPITGLPFYDNMEHPEHGLIAMYGGPLDVYSVPMLQDNDGELRRERYDLDADCWVEGGEPLGYFYREQQPDDARQPVAAAVKDSLTGGGGGGGGQAVSNAIDMGYWGGPHIGLMLNKDWPEHSGRVYLGAPAQAVDLTNVIDQIAQQWDGCSYEAVGETIDVGQAIRAAGKRLIDSQAVGNGQPELPA